MSLIIVLAALAFLMLVAYRGHSVILFAPVAALLAVLCTDPALVAPLFTGLFMEKMAGFVKLYFPVFLLGAVFGKVVELAGFSQAIVSAVVRFMGRKHAVSAVVLVGALLTYGGVSLFVVVFAVYPFGAQLFKALDIPKRLLPAAMALGAFSFTMDALPGTPQIQNLIPGPFFKTTIYAAPVLGCIGGAFIAMTGIAYLEWRCRKAKALGEGYGDALLNEPQSADANASHTPLIIALRPLVLVAVVNRLLTDHLPAWYGSTHSFVPAVMGNPAPVVQDIAKVASIWAVEAALIAGILCVLALSWKRVTSLFAQGIQSAVQGSLLAAMNTASEYGFGAVIAALPGFLVIAEALRAVPYPLINEALTVTSMAGITGSASGGLSIALAAMGESFAQSGIAPEVLHRVASMASGGMDTLPHNGAVITLLTVTGLTHRQAYGDIFVITCLKTLAVGVVIALHYLTGWV